MQIVLSIILLFRVSAMEFFPKISLSVRPTFWQQMEKQMELELHSYQLKLLIYHFYEVLATPWHDLISCAIRFWSRCHSFGNVGRVISIGFPESGVAFRRAQQMSGANASSIESRNPNEQTHMEEEKNVQRILFICSFCISYFYLIFSVFHIYIFSFPFFFYSVLFCFCFTSFVFIFICYLRTFFCFLLLLLRFALDTNTNRYTYSTYIDISFHFLL